MLLQLLQKVDTPDIKAAALSPDSYHSRQQYHLWIIISNQITLWGKKGLYFHIAVDTAWLFIVYMDLVIVVLPIYSLLQCGSERIISVMLVSGSPPPPLSPVWNSQEVVCHGADSICLLSFSDWFFFSLISSSPHSGLLLTGWWWPRRERATAEGAPLARSPAPPTQTSVLGRRRPPFACVMASHLELIQELQQLDKVPSLERLRAAQKRRTQQLKRWAVYEKEMQSKKRKAEKKARSANSLQQECKKHVSFAASVALLEASARNDPEEGRTIGNFIQIHWAHNCGNAKSGLFQEMLEFSEVRECERVSSLGLFQLCGFYSINEVELISPEYRSVLRRHGLLSALADT